ARSRIIDILDVDSGSGIWEIGPGLGAMTHMITDVTDNLTVFEIDYGFIRYLEEAFGNKKGFKIIKGDFVKTWSSVAAQDGKPEKILGNLPYNSASAIVSSLIEGNCIPESMVITVQKEMGQRMISPPGSKNYSSFSMLCQFVFNVRNMGDLKSGSFYPSPDVTSTILELKPHSLYNNVNSQLYFKIIRDLFQSRRKTIKNNLSRGWTGSNIPWEDVENALLKSGIRPGDRGENIPVGTIVELVHHLNNSISVVN
ncbi:MAG: ribosomal RNA small subunit methyltransferase A, partial [Spirochaetales bacterium]|nr:ribosomal RNA small subunit methyltransferase A [Spirochaetales bacterium]